VDNDENASAAGEPDRNEPCRINGVDIDEQVGVLENGGGLDEGDSMLALVCRRFVVIPFKIAAQDSGHYAL